MIKRIQYFFCVIIFLFNTPCYPQKTAPYPGEIKQAIETLIKFSGFFSRDTASITFYKKDSWFILTTMQNPFVPAQLQACHTCQQVFTDSFLNVLFSLQPEKPSNDCRILKDTIINRKLIVSIEDFYMTSDLESETIIITKGEKTSTVSYLEPRYALRYCKNNTNRLAFIRAGEMLLKIK